MSPRPDQSWVEADAEAADLIPELFHALNQPLTSLQCTIELSLQRPRSAEEYRQTLVRSLQQAEEIARLTCAIRDLLQANDPGSKGQILPFRPILREAVADLQPVAESLQVKLLLDDQGDGSVWMEPQRLRQVMFSMIEYGLVRSSAGAEAVLQSREIETEMVLGLTSVASARPEARSAHQPEPLPASPSGHWLGWAVARRMVLAAGGRLQLDDDRGKLNLELRLPLASVAV